MKTTLFALAAAMTVAAPAFAEREVHTYSGTRSAGDAAAAMAHFAADDHGDGARRRAKAAETDMIVTTSNRDLSDFARAKLDTGERGDN